MLSVTCIARRRQRNHRGRGHGCGCGSRRTEEEEEAVAAAGAGDARGEVVEAAGSAPPLPPSSEASSLLLCAVCLEEVRDSAAEAITTLPCSHAYHPGCVLSWLAVHRACPCFAGA